MDNLIFSDDDSLVCNFSDLKWFSDESSKPKIKYMVGDFNRYLNTLGFKSNYSSYRNIVTLAVEKISLVRELECVQRINHEHLHEMYKRLNGNIPGLYSITSDTGKVYYFNYNLLMSVSKYYEHLFVNEMKQQDNNPRVNSDQVLDYFQQYMYSISNRFDENEYIEWLPKDFDTSCILELFYFMDYYIIEERFGIELLAICHCYALQFESISEVLKEIKSINIPKTYMNYHNILDELCGIFID